MADDLKSDFIEVDQTLHGYSEGHRLIEGSTKVAPKDARAMLVLSDASANSSRIPDEGYLTGYPLAETGKYVLARTWAAPEMSRPGCVWTHSLLIDFADLARLASAEPLLKRFKRPLDGAGSGYGTSMASELSPLPTAVPHADIYRAGQWIRALYSKPTSRIIAEREGLGDDLLVVAIWMQQWPRLRRTFRFCSFTVEDRSTSAYAFDLQLGDGTLRALNRMPEVLHASNVRSGDWAGALVADLEQPSLFYLRRFLRDVGADVLNGRAAMAPLIQLFSALDQDARPEELSKAVAKLELLGPGQGRMGRSAAAKMVLSRTDIADPELFRFALDQALVDRDMLGLPPVVIGQALLRWRPELLGSAEIRDEPFRTAVDAVLPVADGEDLVKVLACCPVAMDIVLSVRPDVLQRASLWQLRSIDAARMLQFADVDHESAPEIIAAMISAGRHDCSSLAIERFGIHATIEGLASLSKVELESATSWMRGIAAKPSELAACLSEGVLRNRSMLIGLTTILDPDDIPNSFGEDPWVNAVGQSETSEDEFGEDLLATFLFCRAMGWRSRSVGRLFSLSVQRVHEAMAGGRLPESAWRLIDRKLPWAAPRHEWDRCSRLRRAVVEEFVGRGLPPIEFGTVVNDVVLWASLVDLASQSYRGRRYLERVRNAVFGGNEAWWTERVQIIDRQIKWIGSW